MEWHYEDLVPAFDALGGKHDHDLWPLAVHELAWRRIPGPPLAGQREIWKEVEHPKHGAYRVRAPYEAVLFQRYITSFQGGQPASWSGVEPPFDHFISVLPCDIYRGSVYAIDLILELANAHLDDPEETRPTGSSGGREGGQAQGRDSDELDPEGWIVGSRRELNRALGKSEGYSNYLERQRDMGNLELRTTDDGRVRVHGPRAASVRGSTGCGGLEADPVEAGGNDLVGRFGIPDRSTQLDCRFRVATLLPTDKHVPAGVLPTSHGSWAGPEDRPKISSKLVHKPLDADPFEPLSPHNVTLGRRTVVLEALREGRG